MPGLKTWHGKKRGTSGLPLFESARFPLRPAGMAGR